MFVVGTKLRFAGRIYTVLSVFPFEDIDSYYLLQEVNSGRKLYLAL